MILLKEQEAKAEEAITFTSVGRRFFYPKFRITKSNPSRTAGTSRRTSAGLFAEARPPAASSWCVPNTFPPAATDVHILHTGDVFPNASPQNTSCIAPPSRKAAAGR